jgi:hypothetical protein
MPLREELGNKIRGHKVIAVVLQKKRASESKPFTTRVSSGHGFQLPIQNPSERN